MLSSTNANTISCLEIRRRKRKEKNHASVRNCSISDNPYQKMAQLEISPYSQDFETTQLHHNPMWTKIFFKCHFNSCHPHTGNIILFNSSTSLNKTKSKFSKHRQANSGNCGKMSSVLTLVFISTSIAQADILFSSIHPLHITKDDVFSSICPHPTGWPLHIWQANIFIGWLSIKNQFPSSHQYIHSTSHSSLVFINTATPHYTG